MKILDREWLTENLPNISDIKSTLQYSSNDYVEQFTSGTTTGKMISVFRTRSYLQELMMRIFVHYSKLYSTPPKKIALFGGISHIQAEKKINIKGIEIKNFILSDENALNELAAYNPDVLSCYPTIIREIINNKKIHIPNLKLIKLGGEKIFISDIDKIFNTFQVPVLEQFGSTEMPALFFRLHAAGKFEKYFHLEKRAFEFYFNDNDGWCDLVVKEKKPDILFSIPEAYFTGDEVYIKDKQVVDVRRKNDVANQYIPLIKELLINYNNIQIDINNFLIYYTGGTNIRNNNIIYNNKKYKLVKKQFFNTKNRSNKLPWIL